MNNISITFQRVCDLINSEGCIVGLYTLNNDLWVSCLIRDFGSKILFSVSKDDLIDYAIGNVNLFGLYNNSYSNDAFLIIDSEKYTSIKKLDFDYKKIELGDKFINQIPDSMSISLKEWYYKAIT